MDGITISGHEELRGWQRLISHVPQNVALVDSSFIENIALGEYLKEIQIERVKKICEIAELSEMVNKLPDNYYTEIGENGSKLSGGQRQRIGIARALYKNSEILILDEATSALDYITEAKIMENIFRENPDLTVINITHRRESIKDYDKIFEIKDGIMVKIK